MREGWLKFDFNGLTTNRITKPGSFGNYVQLGLIPYQFGRGISLGAAYDSSGFLGFKSDFAIDQYAPAALLNFNIIPGIYSCNIYVAILKNNQFSIDDLQSNIDALAMSDGSTSSIGKKTYIFAWDHKLHHLFCSNIDIEPYAVYLDAPDQQVDFLHEADITLLTIGVAIEGDYARWDWGFEGAFNRGELLLKSWDRNSLSVAKNDSGSLVASI